MMEGIDEGGLELTLPFDFPLYGSTYSTIYINPNGVLTFNGHLDGRDSWNPDTATLCSTPMVAVLWRDLVTSIYVDESSADSVTVRWSGVYYNTTVPVSFSAMLHADGTIRFRYGEGNANGGMIGVSTGNELFYTLAAESSFESTTNSMNNANDIVFTPWAPFPAGFSLSSRFFHFMRLRYL